jgi:hypothetical protein
MAQSEQDIVGRQSGREKKKAKGTVKIESDVPIPVSTNK